MRKMNVKEAINLLSYGTAYEIKGAYSGRIYHRSYTNSGKNLDKYADKEVTENPFYTTLAIRGATSANEWCIAVVGIWMYDYDILGARKNEM